MEFLREPAAGMLDLNQLFFHLFPHQSLIGGVSLTRVRATHSIDPSIHPSTHALAITAGNLLPRLLGQQEATNVQLGRAALEHTASGLRCHRCLDLDLDLSSLGTIDSYARWTIQPARLHYHHVD